LIVHEGRLNRRYESADGEDLCIWVLVAVGVRI
jgi:hypothetical protein